MENQPGQVVRMLILLRDGKDPWNEEDRVSCWTDVDLSDRGKEWGRKAGRVLKEDRGSFDVAFISAWERAVRNWRNAEYSLEGTFMTTPESA